MLARFYRAGDAPRWDEFCAHSYCSTFLHTRRFLSYHGERFQDRSIVIEHAGDWVGVMPAALEAENAHVVVSHPGSTFGGIVQQGGLRGSAMLDGLRAIRLLLCDAGLERLRYKAVPYIYHRSPAQDDLYGLSRLGAWRYRCDLTTCIDVPSRLPISTRRRRSLKRASASALSIASGRDHLPALWPVVEQNLAERHGVRPTHSLQEMTELTSRFPEEISIFVSKLDGEIVAGIVLFTSARVVHAQYIASTQRGMEVSALDALLDASINKAAAGGIRYFDFGISTEAQGTALNDGLYRFKSEFGGSGIVHEFYELDLRGVDEHR